MSDNDLPARAVSVPVPVVPVRAGARINQLKYKRRFIRRTPVVMSQSCKAIAELDFAVTPRELRLRSAATASHPSRIASRGIPRRTDQAPVALAHQRQPGSRLGIKQALPVRRTCSPYPSIKIPPRVASFVPLPEAVRTCLHAASPRSGNSVARLAASGHRPRQDVQRRSVPVPNVFLMHRIQRDLIERKRSLNQTTILRHGLLRHTRRGQVLADITDLKGLARLIDAEVNTIAVPDHCMRCVCRQLAVRTSETSPVAVPVHRPFALAMNLRQRRQLCRGTPPISYRSIEYDQLCDDRLKHVARKYG